MTAPGDAARYPIGAGQFARAAETRPGKPQTRRNCFHTEFHLPNAAGKSRHGAPVRQIQSIPSSLCRWFTGGRPPREEAVVRNGAKIAHSSSVISPRITVDLKFTKRPVKIDCRPIS